MANVQLQDGHVYQIDLDAAEVLHDEKPAKPTWSMFSSLVPRGWQLYRLADGRYLGREIVGFAEQFREKMIAHGEGKSLPIYGKLLSPVEVRDECLLRGLDVPDCVAQEIERETTECHVTLLQMAAIVNRSKRHLERVKEKLPSPAIKGGDGRPDEWLWLEVRPILNQLFKRQLPEVFPADRFLRK